MKNLPFVIWMLGYPLVIAIERYLMYLQNPEIFASPPVEFITYVCALSIWIYIGKLVYVKEK